jgi:succinyl-CoA synthetase beta subunit
VRDAAAKMLGTKMETYQSGRPRAAGQPVLVTEATDIAQGAVPVGAGRPRHAVGHLHRLADGGVDIEQVAARTPSDQDRRGELRAGPAAYQCRKLASRWAWAPSRSAS